MIALTAPLPLMLLCWGVTGLVAITTLIWLDALPLVQVFLAREGLSLSAFTLTGLFWLIIGMMAYALGDRAALLTLPERRSFQPRLDLIRAAQLTFSVNFILLGVTGLWIATAALQLGGLSGLIRAVYEDSLTTRNVLLDNKLFTGMRLFYAALPATGCLAAALLATDALPTRSRRMCLITVFLNVIALFVLPIVMSQRLLLLQLLLSSYLAACLVRRRIFGLRWLGLGVALFLTLWVAREAITNPLHDGSAAAIAFQKLAFYVVNDTWNSMAPLAQPIPHTWGQLSFEGLSFLTLTDRYLQATMAPIMAELDAVLGGGEFPFFTSAYVDFGPVFGAVFICVFGFVFRIVYHLARQSLGWAAIYAQIGAALLFSSHSVYVTHQNFLFSILLLALIARASRRWPRRSAVCAVRA